MARLGQPVVVTKGSGYTPVAGIVSTVYPSTVAGDAIMATVFLRGQASAAEGWEEEFCAVGAVGTVDAVLYVDSSTPAPYYTLV